MNRLVFAVILFSLGLCSIDLVNAENENSEPEIVVPDLIINFDDQRYWYGLESGNNPYWKIEDGVGKFNLSPGILSPGERQLESATIDFEKLLGERIGEDWVLRYKLSIDEFKQGTDSSWSQLLIGLFSKPNSGTDLDITHGDAEQWGIGTAFMTGVDMTHTALMYDLSLIHI